MNPTGPANAAVGDMGDPARVPQTEVPEEILEEEKKLARFSKTAEYKRLQSFMEDRIKFYQGFLPNGTPVKEANENSLGEAVVNWKVANIVISEFQGVLDAYERAKETVKNVQ